MSLFQNPNFLSLLNGLLVEFVFTILGVLFALTILKWWNDWRYGRWTLTIIHHAQSKLDRIPISPEKMKQVTEVPEDMPVFLKGKCGSYKIISCDLMHDGVETHKGLTIDKKRRTIFIDLDKLPGKDVLTPPL